ncbi:hypothetical protein [Ancylobacter polymorphus]|uniref:Uncharacterized protein n=1 Tax=Ancylobacter polymorphus TaxID=223390 RepID=A0ABU0BC49_9HYPH|nr:hypothetical protein [Ancylobacter polymorphus]MDQ0302891.1 hypothetical protein [Ancylobacter polymorphus]
MRSQASQPFETNRRATGRRIRAARSEERDAIIGRRAAALRPFLGRGGEECRTVLRRLLRAERRAAGSGLGYDAARHAALARLLAELDAPLRPAAVARNEKGRHTG